MKKIKLGKIISSVMFILIFFIGLYILLNQPTEKMDKYLLLCNFTIWPLLFIMGGIVGKSLIKEFFLGKKGKADE